MRLFFYCIPLYLLFTHCQSPQVAPPNIAPKCTIQLDSNSLHLSQTFDRYFSQSMQQFKGIGAAVAIVKDSQIILLKGYGLRKYNTSDSIDTKTVFRIGSLSKGFTGVLAGIMIHQNKLQWTDKVVKWIPDFSLRDRVQGKRVELRHLLSHTTGLPYHAYTNLVEDGYDLGSIVRNYFPKSPVCGKEGVFYAYQNAAFALSGRMLEAASGQSFQDLITQKIFIPAHMPNTSCSYASIESNPNKAYPHQWSGYNWVCEPISPAYYNVAEAGGINANISDMAQWLKVVLGQRPDIVTNAVLDTVFSPVVKTGNERRILGHWFGRDEASYAMGWRILENETDSIVYHSGYVNGYRSEIALDRKKGIGICVLFNGQTGLCGNCVQDFFTMVKQNEVGKKQ